MCLTFELYLTLSEYSPGRVSASRGGEIVKAAAGFRTRGKVNESSVSSHAADKAAQQMAEALTREEGRVELRQLFRQLDSDGDGRLTSEEWARGMGKQGTAMAKYFGGSTLEDLARIFSKIDANGDGSLTWEELVAGAADYRLRNPLASSPRHHREGSPPRRHASPP